MMNDFRHRLEGEIPRLRRYARALTRNAVRADDLVQETLVRALHKEHLWQPGTDLRAWLFTIMHNQNVNEIRRAIRDDATVDLENCSAILTATTDPTASRQLRELDHALAQVPEEQRQVVLLVGLEGMSYEDAAAILDVPIGTIRSRLSRGRESLRKLMDMDVKPASSAASRNFTPRHSADAPPAVAAEEHARPRLD
jgi:RNA polymerase sigma-70 factor (ECF subfamily)